MIDFDEKQEEEFIPNKELSKKIRDFTNQGKYDEAEKLCYTALDDIVIISQLVTVLVKKGKLKEAKEICNNNKDKPILQSQLISILIQEGDLKSAKEICKKEEFKDNQAIKNQLKKIKRMEKR